MPNSYMLHVLILTHERPFIDAFLLDTGSQITYPKRAWYMQRLLMPLPLIPVPQLFATESAEESGRFAHVGGEFLVLSLLNLGVETPATSGTAVAGARVRLRGVADATGAADRVGGVDSRVRLVAVGRC